MKNGIQTLGFRLYGKSLFLACQVRNGFRERVTILRNAEITPGAKLFLLVVFAAICFAADYAMGTVGAMFGVAAFSAEQSAEIEKVVKAVGEKERETIKSEIENAIKATGFDKDLGEKLTKEFGKTLETLGIKADVIKAINETIEKQGEALRKIENNKPGETKTVETIVEENADKLKLLSQHGAEAKFKIHLPPGILTKTQVARASVSGSTMAMRLLEVGQLPYLGMKMSQLFRHAPVAPSSNGVIRFYDQNAITRAAAAVAEGGTKPESAITWIERLLKIEKIADSIPVTKEAWADVYFIQSEIDRLLNLNLALIEDQYLWSGTGVTPQITGVYTTAAAVDLTATYAGKVYSGTVKFANVYDLIATMRVIVMNNKQSKYAPNIVVMNPADILGYKLVKDNFGRYLVPGFVTADGTAIDGCQVIESSQVTPNTLLVGDSRYGTIYDLEGITLEMGYINDQFIKNAMTLLAEKREALLIRNVDADAFLKCTDIVGQVALLNTL